MKSSLFLTFIIAALCIGCGNNDHQHQDQQSSQTGNSSATEQLLEAPEDFKADYAVALEAYFELKDALVQTDAATAAQKATVLGEKVESVDHSGLQGESLELWLMHKEVMLAGAGRIAGEVDVEEQRVHFDPLSESFIETVTRYQPVGYTVYEQMCPMVRGGSANWLSKEEQIANPYHGDRMMRCGSVVSRI